MTTAVPHIDAIPARDRRSNAGMSLRDLEAATGINRGLLSWWERGLFNLRDDQESAVVTAIHNHEQAAAAAE